MSEDFNDSVCISREDFALIEQKCSRLAKQVEALTRENQRLQSEVLALKGGDNRRSSIDLGEGVIKRKKTKVSDGHGNVHHNFNNSNANNPNIEIPDANLNINSTATTANLSTIGSTINVDNHLNNTNKLKKKIIQAIDTNVFVIRKHLLNAKCTEFSVKQKNLNGPVKITVNEESEIPIVKVALLENKTSFHEFKWESEKQKSYIIRGLVGMCEVEP